MMTIRCGACGGEMQAAEGRTPKLCPYCGKPFDGTAPKNPPGPSPLDERLAAERNPKKKYAMICAALDNAPDDFFANRALLYHGRLHEPMHGGGLDFSIIKCHLLSVFETPEKYKKEARDAKLDELLRGAQLRKTMALAPDADAFFAEYLGKLAYEYIDLFIRGDSANSRVAFGFLRPPDALARRCAEPVRKMLRAVGETDRLTGAERALLLSALRDGYQKVFARDLDDI